jgi:hypothetical protein
MTDVSCHLAYASKGAIMTPNHPLDRDVTAVAGETTGVYGISLFEPLEARGLQGLLIDPH